MGIPVSKLLICGSTLFGNAVSGTLGIPVGIPIPKCVLLRGFYSVLQCGDPNLGSQIIGHISGIRLGKPDEILNFLRVLWEHTPPSPAPVPAPTPGWEAFGHPLGLGARTERNR